MSKIKDAIMEEEEKQIEKLNPQDTIKVITNNGNKHEIKVKNILQYNDEKLEYKVDLTSYMGDLEGWKIVSINMHNIESVTLYHHIY